jgi:hypothetical protein
MPFNFSTERHDGGNVFRFHAESSDDKSVALSADVVKQGGEVERLASLSYRWYGLRRFAPG